MMHQHTYTALDFTAAVTLVRVKEATLSRYAYSANCR